MEWLLTAIHADRRLFDSLWYEAFPPSSDPAQTANCDVDAILGMK